VHYECKIGYHTLLRKGKGSIQGVKTYLGVGRATATQSGKSFAVVLRQGERANFPQELLDWIASKGIVIIDEIAF
jgi:hypothetical protein